MNETIAREPVIWSLSFVRNVRCIITFITICHYLKRAEATEDWRMLHNERLLLVWFSSDIRMISSRKAMVGMEYDTHGR
jgi:hypothetical protein